VDERTIVEEISALMLERHPEWVGREWIEKGVGCLCSEHAEHTEHAEHAR
jgi:hypothetical protein